MNTTGPTPDSWLSHTLSDERWFRDGEPQWRYLPSSLQARIERFKRVRLLKKHGLSKLSAILAACAPRARCLSGCCPECGRAFQRFFAVAATRLLIPHTEYDTVSIVGRTHRLADNLHSLSLDAFSSRLLRLLRRGRAGLALGGIDFSFNEFPTSSKTSRWVPHFWLLVHNANRSRWERVLRIAYPARALVVPRPVKVESWDGDISALGYALKTKFERRISTTTIRFARGKYRPCQNTKHDRLRSAERAELFSYLHNVGLEGRLVLFEVIKVSGGFDVAL